MISVNREDFLLKLQSVQPGLSSKEIIEQSTCLLFQGSKIITYNDEIACSIDSPLKLTAAVQAAPLIAILQKMKEETIEIEEAEGELVVVGKRKRAGIKMEKEVFFKEGTVETPENWKSVPSDFLEAIDIIQQCAGTDESQFNLTCIHIHPEWIEACDNYQAARFALKTKFKESILIRRGALKHIIGLGISEFASTGSWVHFRNSSGLVFSCRKYVEEYPKIEQIFEGTGHKIVFPKGLIEAADKAIVFSAENATNKLISINLRPGKLRIRGEGVYGWYSEVCKVKYKGEALSFLMSPKVLQEISQKHNSGEIVENRLKITGDKFVYVTCLGKGEEAGTDE